MALVCCTNFSKVGLSQQLFVFLVAIQSEHNFSENKGSMWWPVIVSILLCYFYFFVSSGRAGVTKPNLPEPVPEPFTYKLTSRGNRLSFKRSGGKRWDVELDDSFHFHRGQIYAKDECFGKTPGTFIKARGKSLYQYIKESPLKLNENGRFNVNVKEALQSGQIFYFKCADNHIGELLTCPPGQIFDGSCVSAHPCLDQPKGTLVADTFDKEYYYLCPQGRHKCPNGTFFLIDACHSESSLENACSLNAHFQYTINSNTFVTCIKGFPKIVTCPPGKTVFENKCVNETCLHQPDGTKIAFPKEHVGPFWFSSGYDVCKNNQIEKSIECPVEWDQYESKGDNVNFLPQVFHNGTCSVPEFCTNVTTNDPNVVVPSYDFTKNVKNWENSLYFDQSTGYKCDQHQKVKFYAPPGERISEFKVTSACDAPGKRVVIGNQLNKYYDCDQKDIVSCLPGHFFDGTLCKAFIPHAHQYKNIDMFTLDELEFNWIKPWTYSKESSVEKTCQDPEPVYISGYNVCSHSECVQYPFLKQLKAHIQLDEESKCTFKNGKISKVKTPRRKHFNFWKQRKSIRYEQCVPGSKIQSGHFLMDSVLYATCDSKQPFVFCPSVATREITLIDNSFACVPEDGVFEGILEANTSKSFLENHLARVIPSPGSRLKINGKTQPFDPNGIEIDPNPVEIWSDKEVRLIFKMLVNHPPHTYFENKRLKHFKNTNRIFVTRYASGSTSQPIHFPTYTVRDSVSNFKSDAS